MKKTLLGNQCSHQFAEIRGFSLLLERFCKTWMPSKVALWMGLLDYVHCVLCKDYKITISCWGPFRWQCQIANSFQYTITKTILSMTIAICLQQWSLTSLIARAAVQSGSALMNDVTWFLCIRASHNTCRSRKNVSYFCQVL